MTLKVQDLIKNEGESKLNDLRTIGIECKFETSPVTGKEYLHLDYSMNAPRENPLVKECRGLVLERHTWDIVRLSFERFMNLGETGCDIKFIPNDKTLYEYEEKADGSIIPVSYFDGRWVAGTRGFVFPTAKLLNGMTLDELFWKISGLNKEDNCLNSNYCYTFEMCSMFNRVVIPYKNSQLVLLNVRDKKNNWREFRSDELANECQLLISCGFKNLRRPDVHSFNTIKDCVEATKNLSGFEEGFVAKKWIPELDRYHRVKIKGQAYLDLHHVVTGFSLTNLVKMIFENRRTYLETFEEELSVYDLVEEKIKEFNFNVAKNCLELMERVESIEDPKERKKQYALSVKGLGVHPVHEGLLFNLYVDNSQDVYSLVKKNIREKAHFKKFVACLNVVDLLNSKWNCSTEMSDDI